MKVVPGEPRVILTQIRSLWLRVYFLLFIAYQLLALVGACLWWVFVAQSGGAFASLLATYVLLTVPGGFGVTLIASIPAAALWFFVARAMGWSLAPPQVPGTARVRCASCGYDVSGLGAPRCPECGLSLESEGDSDTGRAEQVDDASGAVR